MESLAFKIKSAFTRWTNGAVQSHSRGLFGFASDSTFPTEDELLFEEMDLIVREEINRLEQGLTDYLRSRLGSKVNEDVESRYISRITELYEQWAFLEFPEDMNSNSSSTTMKDFEIEEKRKELKKRRQVVDKQIAKRISAWKKAASKKAVIELEDGILLGNGYTEGTFRTMKYTIVHIHSKVNLCSL